MQDWEQFGEEIRRTVQDAVDSQNFTRLNQNISDTINQAMNSVDRIINYGKYRGPGGPMNFGPGPGPGQGYGPQGGPGQAAGPQGAASGAASRNSYQYAGAGQANGGASSGGASAGSGFWAEADKHTQEYRASSREVAIYDPGLASRAGGVLMTALGFGVGAVLLVLLIVSGFAAAAEGPGFSSTAFQVTMGLLGVLTAGCGAMGVKGLSVTGLVGRFRAYVQELNGREFCDVKELAQRVGKSSKYVVRDLEKMIGKGWFRQGHLDRLKTCLMVTDQAYGQYQKLEEQMDQKQRDEQTRRDAEEKQRQQGEAERASLPPEVRRIVEQGDAYIEKIRACNQAIPGKEISEKISRMENLVDRIFDRVEQSPESVTDIHRLMDYYLPTTVKLLEAYQELDRQPASGANIQNSKKEIEATLDTLNTAFEKLLDDLFQDTAWDLSSDISVLHAMLAQEGLTPDGMKTS